MSIPIATKKARFKLIKSRFSLSGAWRSENGVLKLIAVTRGIESDVQLPEVAGIYLFVAKEVVQYVGKANNLHQRVGSYIRAAKQAVQAANGGYELKKSRDRFKSFSWPR